MDEKFIRRFESFRNSLDSLAEAKQRDLSDSFVLSGTSAKFSITFDLAWKVMKDILVQYYAITGFVTGSPREVLRESFQANLITGDEWIRPARRVPLRGAFICPDCDPRARLERRAHPAGGGETGRRRRFRPA